MTHLYNIGDEVFVHSMKANGIIRSISSDKTHVKVFIGSLTVTVNVTDLGPPKKISAKPSSTISFLTTSSKERVDASSVDLHGMTVLEALHALEATLSKALLANVREFRVIHGIGTGRVQSAVHEYLSKQPLVTSFMPDPWNVGVTRVFL